LNSLDWILLAIFTFAAFKGYRKGFILEIISIAALFIGVLGALKLLDFGKEFIAQRLQIDGDILPYLSFLLLFILIVVLLNLLGRAVKKLVDMTLLGNLDDIAGCILGVIKWGLILSFIIWAANIIHLQLPEKWTEGSIIYPYISMLAPGLFTLLSSIFPYIKELIDYFTNVI